MSIAFFFFLVSSWTSRGGLYLLKQYTLQVRKKILSFKQLCENVFSNRLCLRRVFQQAAFPFLKNVDRVSFPMKPWRTRSDSCLLLELLILLIEVRFRDAHNPLPYKHSTCIPRWNDVETTVEYTNVEYTWSVCRVSNSILSLKSDNKHISSRLMAISVVH